VVSHQFTAYLCEKKTVNMIKYTAHYLKKLEDILQNNQYELRYEKGNFKSGFCILETKKVVVVNKFAGMESRINALVEIIRVLGDKLELDPESKQLVIAGVKSESKAVSVPDEPGSL
jgi:hypothetical protein